MTQTPAATWFLEVVRGRDVGRTYALRSGDNVLGNALNGDAGVDLAEQEANSPRRMAARQARLTCSERGLTLGDLESPGGTFVNRQRLLPGQTRSLEPGDVIQLGGVQLKVVGGGTPTPPANRPPAPAVSPPPLPANTGPLPAPFLLATGHACRSWDDFLTVAAQRWVALRDELVSGRLGAYFASIQRPDHIPSPTAPGSADERLDEWLGKLPTTRPSRPELEVHPATLVVRAVPGGGVTRREIQVTNVGYRLLRSTLRPEPASASWIVVPPEVAGTPLVTVERTAVPIELRIPENWDRTLVGGLVVESNGGTRRVEVRIERAPAPDVIPDTATSFAVGRRPSTAEWIERLSAGQRFIGFGLAGLVARSLVLAGGVLFEGSATPPSLRGAVVLGSLLGAVAAAWLARRVGERRDVPTSAFAGAIGGVLAGTVLVAACRAVEPWVGLPPLVAVALSLLLWSGLGLASAAVSLRVVPRRVREREAQP